MNRDMVIEYVARYFGIRPNDDGTYDLNDYDWTSGCYAGVGGRWLCLKSFIDIFDEIAADNELYDDEWERW